MNTTSAGNAAEDAVARELAHQGYTIIERNWKTRAAEIDIVATKGKTLYFVEVKYRRTDKAGDGFDYITVAKLRHMDRAALLYVEKTGWNGPCMLAAAAVAPGRDGYDIDVREIA